MQKHIEKITNVTCGRTPIRFRSGKVNSRTSAAKAVVEWTPFMSADALLHPNHFGLSARVVKFLSDRWE